MSLSCPDPSRVLHFRESNKKHSKRVPPFHCNLPLNSCPPSPTQHQSHWPLCSTCGLSQPPWSMDGSSSPNIVLSDVLTSYLCSPSGFCYVSSHWNSTWPFNVTLQLAPPHPGLLAFIALSIAWAKAVLSVGAHWRWTAKRNWMQSRWDDVSAWLTLWYTAFLLFYVYLIIWVVTVQ